MISVSTTAKPGKPVPRFCKLLKFDCEKRSNPLCCKESPDELGHKETVYKEKVIKGDRDIKTIVNTTGINKGVSNVSDNDNTDIADDISSQVFLGRKPFSPSKRKNSYSSQRSSSILSKRPSSLSSGKSSLCQIINCLKAHNKKHKCCREELDQNVTEKQEIQSESIDKAKEAGVEDTNKKTVTESKSFEYRGKKKDTKTNKKKDIKLNKKNGKTVEESFQTTTENTITSSTSENTISDLQSTLDYTIGDNTVEPEEHPTTHVDEIETTEESVTETIESEVTTVQQEINTLEGTGKENETSLFDSIMNQLLNFNISNIDAFESKNNRALTEVITTEESINETTNVEEENNTESYTTILVTEHYLATTEITTFEPEEKEPKADAQENMEVAENITAMTPVISKTIEVSTTKQDSDQDEQSNLTVVYSNAYLDMSEEETTVSPISFREVFEIDVDIKNIDNDTSGHVFHDSDKVLSSLHDNKEKIDVKESEPELFVGDSSNKVYIGGKASKVHSSYAGNLIPATLTKTGGATGTAPYTVISLPGYSNIRQPFVLQYPGMVTATITRVSKSYSWL